MKNQIIDRIEYCITEAEKELQELETKYNSLKYGIMSIDIIMQLERCKGEIRALKNMRSYIKYDV